MSEKDSRQEQRQEHGQPAIRHGWMVTRDHVGDDEDSRVGTCGPEGLVPELEARLRGGEGALWRTLDPDGNPVHEGRFIELDGAAPDAIMAPLDEFSQGEAGATELQVRRDRTQSWRPV